MPTSIGLKHTHEHPFACVNVQFNCEREIKVELTDVSERVRSLIPQGQRIDFCLVHSFSMQLHAGDQVDVKISVDPKPGWEVSAQTGEAFASVELASGDSSVASVGIRDEEWNCSRFDLKLVSGTWPNLGNKHTAEPSLLLNARYLARRDTFYRMQVASALTTNAISEQLEVSPWFATDRAIEF